MFFFRISTKSTYFEALCSALYIPFFSKIFKNYLVVVFLSFLLRCCCWCGYWQKYFLFFLFCCSDPTKFKRFIWFSKIIFFFPISISFLLVLVLIVLFWVLFFLSCILSLRKSNPWFKIGYSVEESFYHLVNSVGPTQNHNKFWPTIKKLK